MGEKKPPELNDRFWEELTQIRKTEASKQKLVLMGNQARNRGLRNSTKEKIQQAAIVKLGKVKKLFLRKWSPKFLREGGTTSVVQNSPRYISVKNKKYLYKLQIKKRGYYEVQWRKVCRGSICEAGIQNGNFLCS